MAIALNGNLCKAMLGGQTSVKTTKKRMGFLLELIKRGRGGNSFGGIFAEGGK